MVTLCLGLRGNCCSLDTRSGKGRSLAALGIICMRSLWVGACRETAKDASCDWAKSSSLSGMPTVDTVTRRWEKPSPIGSRITCKALWTWDQLSRGSPMPIKTMFRKGHPVLAWASTCLAIRT